MFTLTDEQKVRFDAWFDDCVTTHRHFAYTVRDVILPQRLASISAATDIDGYLDELEGALRAMRHKGG